MTEQANAELIAEAKTYVTDEYITPDTRPEESLIRRLAAALEAADQLAEIRGETIRTYERENADWERRVHITERKAAEYAAVVEKAEDYVTRHYLDTRAGDEILSVLAAVPAEALAEHDAKVRAEELREAYADVQAYTDSGAPFGHRPVEEFLLRRADRIEREAGLK